MSSIQQAGLSPNLLNFGVQKYKSELLIDSKSIFNNKSKLWVIDVETNEKDQFVGLALTNNQDYVYYFSVLNQELVTWLQFKSLIGHNIKFDAKLLKQWSVSLNADNLYGDTMLMSYVQNTTKESHGLKELAKEHTKLEWPTYKEIVGKGRKKVTLDKQPMELVANYCGMDVLATLSLYNYYNRILTPIQRHILNNIELPIMRLLFNMELQGINIDFKYLCELKEKFSKESFDTLSLLSNLGLSNPRSPKQVVEWLKKEGINVESSDQRVLQDYKAKSPISLLLQYREAFKLLSTYVEPLLERAPKIHTTFNQITYSKSDDKWLGIRTGRLSSSEPNLHNIPVRTNTGKLLRKVFIAPKDKLLICADYSQIEYRLLAHFSGQKDLIEAFKEGKDIHEETGKILGADRKLGKTLNFAAIYGAGAEKISKTAQISREDSERFLALYWSKLGDVKKWIQRVKHAVKLYKGIKTILGHWIPLPGINSSNPYEVFHWERAAVNYIIQGSAAEIIKLAMLVVDKNGYHPILQVHDELLFEVPAKDFIEPISPNHPLIIQHIMESVISLRVPVVVDIGYGKNWSEAKGE